MVAVSLKKPAPMLGRPVSASLVDPEDDLTPARYAGDFGSGTTTVIPPYDAASSGVGNSGYSLFFQAEDGIRDIGVTGVQTCALPI